MPTALQSIDPRTGQAGPEVPQTTSDELEAVLRAADNARHDERLADNLRRAQLLRDIAERLRARRELIATTAQAETGLPEARLQGELERTCIQLEMLADVVGSGEHLDVTIDHADADARPVPRPDLRRMLVPLGPVAVFGASNFPLAFSTAGGDTASALAAGCPVLVKGHPAHPLTGTIVADAVTDAVRNSDLPEGTFGHVLSAGIELGVELVTDDRIEAVGFTGSTTGGMAIAAAAATRPRPIPVFAEMGSVNPLVITRKAAAARSEEIAAGLAASVATFGGQLCTKPGVVLIESDGSARALATTVAAALMRRGSEPLLTQSIAAAYRNGAAALGEIDGVERLTPQATADAEGFNGLPAAYIASASLLADQPAIGEEHFGPAVMFLIYENVNGLREALMRLGGQLTLTLHAEPEEVEGLQWLVELGSSLAGRVIFDGFPTGVSVCWAMQHGGPFPATTDSRGTSVGMTAVRRFLRPVAYQNFPSALLPTALRDDNPYRLTRRIDGVVELA